MYICTDVSGLRLILVLTRAFAMRNAVQKKIKDLEETQLQKLDLSRVEYCMYDFDSAPPFPPLPSGPVVIRIHDAQPRTAQPGRAA